MDELALKCTEMFEIGLIVVIFGRKKKVAIWIPKIQFMDIICFFSYLDSADRQ